MLILTVSVGRRVRIGDQHFQLVSVGRYGTATFTYRRRTYTIERGDPISVGDDDGFVTFLLPRNGMDRGHSTRRARFGFDFPRSVQIVREEAER